MPLMNPELDCKTPGQLVGRLLEARGWSKRVLSIVLSVDESIVNKIVSDRRAVSASMALMLGEAFNVEPEIFLELQKSFDLAKARFMAQPDPGRATRAALFGDLPVAEMIKRRWLRADDIRDTKKVEAELMRFFRVDSLDKIEILPVAAKKTNYSAEPTAAQVAWIQRVRLIADEMMVGHYTPFAGRAAIKKLASLLLAPQEIRKVPRILAESGIRFVIVESLPSAKIDGVCFWLDDSPVIGMSLRFDRIDNFWFVLRHELEHVIQNHGRDVVMVDELEGERAGTGTDIAVEERIANEAAADFCVPKQELKKFINKKAPIFAERDILGFAATLQIHPGLVAGQLQHHTTRYDLFRNHLVKTRHLVTPSAMVDGWGDIFVEEV